MKRESYQSKVRRTTADIFALMGIGIVVSIAIIGTLTVGGL